MADTDEGAVVEEIYLENRTTRKAFYHVSIRRTPKQHIVVVHWGPLGTDGQTSVKNRCASLDAARVKMNTIAEAKKLRNYQVAKKPKGNSKASVGFIDTATRDNEMNRFADLE